MPLANGDYNPDGATRKFNDKLAEFLADQQATNNPVTAAAGFVSTMVTAVATAESAAATASGNALSTAVNTIGTADVSAVTTATNADSAYSTASVGNDKTYLDGMATAESDYLKVVAGKWHEFRTGTITAAQRDAAIATKWTEFQTAAAQKRNTFRNDQAGDAATFRNTLAGAAKTHVDTVTTAEETLTNSLQNGQKTLTQQKADAWLTASKGLVNLDTNSTIQKADSLAEAIGELAGEDPVYGSSGSNGNPFGTVSNNPFWVALSQKADQSAEYIADTKNAERLYYGRSPWSGNVNGTRGVLDARRDYEVGMADAAATQNKALQHSAGTRDRELADAGLQLAQARSTYETDWARLNLESSGWHLDQPSLPITGAIDGTVTLTAGVGTTFVPGWFSVPRLSEAGVSPTTSTGFSSLDLDHYFTSGLMPDMPDTDPVTTGKASRDDSRFGAALIQPAGRDGNETVTPGPQEGQTQVETGDDVAYEPPAETVAQWTVNMQPEGPGYAVIDGRKMMLLDGNWVVLNEEPTGPGDFSVSLPTDIKLQLDNPFESQFLGTDNSFSGTPFDLSWRDNASRRDQETIVVIVVDNEVYELRLNEEEMADLAFSLMPPEEQFSLIEQAERKAELAAAEDAYDKAFAEWESVNRQIEEAIAKFNWQSISQDEMKSFLQIATNTGVITDGSGGRGNDKFEIIAFRFQGATYTYRQVQPNPDLVPPWAMAAAIRMTPWTLQSIVRSEHYSTAFAVKSALEEQLTSNIGFELFAAVIPGGSTAGTIEEEYYAPGGKRRWGRVGVAFIADVLETLTVYGKLRHAGEARSLYSAMAVAHGANALYAGADAASRFANGEDGAWGKSLEALLSAAVGSASARTLVADFKVASQTLAAAATKVRDAARGLAADSKTAGQLTIRQLGGRANSIEGLGTGGLNSILANFRDARQVRALLQEIELSMQKHYTRIYSMARSRRFTNDQIGTLIGKAVEDEMIARFGQGLSGIPLARQARIDFLTAGMIANRADGIPAYRLADLLLEGRGKVIVELTLEDIRGINTIAAWRRISRHKRGQLSDYILGGTRVVVITPW